MSALGEAYARDGVVHIPGALDAAVSLFAPVVKPMIYGSLLIGLIAAAGSYYPTRRAVRVFQKRCRHA